MLCWWKDILKKCNENEKKDKHVCFTSCWLLITDSSPNFKKHSEQNVDSTMKTHQWMIAKARWKQHVDGFCLFKVLNCGQFVSSNQCLLNLKNSVIIIHSSVDSAVAGPAHKEKRLDSFFNLGQLYEANQSRHRMLCTYFHRFILSSMDEDHYGATSPTYKFYLRD